MQNSKRDNRTTQSVTQIFGVNLFSHNLISSNPDFRSLQYIPGKMSAKIYFEYASSPPFPVDWKTGKVVYSKKNSTKIGEAWDIFYHFDTYDVLRFWCGVDFYMLPERIDCHLRDPADKSWMEIYLLGAVLAFWLEREGIPALHASAVVVDNQALAFPSKSGRGKSTLAAAFVQAGAKLLTDDILPLRKQLNVFLGAPGMPQFNFWPNQYAHFVKNNEAAQVIVSTEEKKHIPVSALKNGRFCEEQKALACIYLPRQTNQSSGKAKIEIRPISQIESIIELVRHSFFPSAVFESLGWQKRRLDFFARLVQQIPVRRLVYPSGFEQLPRVVDAVLKDLESLPSQ